MKLLRSAVLTATLLGLALIAGPPVAHLLAQTALTQNTLSAALAAPAHGSPATVVTLTSGTGVSAGVGFAIDNEYMVAQSATPQTTRWNVTRGQSGTVAGDYASGAAALIGGGEAKIYTFPQGNIAVLGATASLAETTTSAILTTLNGGKTLSVARFHLREWWRFTQPASATRRIRSRTAPTMDRVYLRQLPPYAPSLG